MSGADGYTSSTLAAINLVGRTEGAVKRLAAFRKDRHVVPDAVNTATQGFLAKLAAGDLAEEGENWFQRARAALDYKRRDITLNLGAGTAMLAARDFMFEITWSLQTNDPASYTITRTLHALRDPAFVQGDRCSTLFAATFTDIVFTLTKGVSVEAVIDAVEGLTAETSLAVDYPSSCAECTLTVPGVEAAARFTGTTLEMVFPRPGSPRELLAAFAEVRSAFRLSRDDALTALL